MSHIYNLLRVLPISADTFTAAVQVLHLTRIAQVNFNLFEKPYFCPKYPA